MQTYFHFRQLNHSRRV